jgi:hypothetical protein
MSTPKIDVVITRHHPLIKLLRERGIIDDSTPVLEHASASDVAGKHVLGVLPHHLSSRCASITEVPMALTQADREAMTRGDLTLERTREVAGEPVTYRVTEGAPDYTHEMAECHRRAMSHAAAWTWPPNMRAAQGLVEYTGAEGLDDAQVDVYSRGRPRYRTRSMGHGWSVWMNSDGEASDDQEQPMANARGTWLKTATDRVGDAAEGSEIEIWDLDVELSDRPLRGYVRPSDNASARVQVVGHSHPRHHHPATPCVVLRVPGHPNCIAR